MAKKGREREVEKGAWAYSEAKAPEPQHPPMTVCAMNGRGRNLGESGENRGSVILGRGLIGTRLLGSRVYRHKISRQWMNSSSRQLTGGK